MTPRRLALAADAFAVVVTISVAVAAARLSWRLAGDPGVPGPAEPVAQAAAPPLDLAPVAAFAPFGSAVAASGPSTQPLVLRGILLAQPRAASTVLLAVGGAPVAAFAIGASAGGATVEAIEVDHIMLRTSGGVQRLDYPTAVAGTIPPAAATVPPPPGAPMSGVDALRALSPQASRGTPPPPPPATGFLDSIGATPTPGGYRIGAGVSPTMQAAGLRPGDLIERVNGARLGAADGDRRVLAAAMAAGTARVEVARDGRRVTLSFPLR